MRLEYEKLFKTPEELTDFVLLDPEEQEAELYRLALEGRPGLETVCELRDESEGRKTKNMVFV